MILISVIFDAVFNVKNWNFYVLIFNISIWNILSFSFSNWILYWHYI
jgi:hypothetical protein